MSDEHVNRDDLAAYALGALEPADVDRLEQHVPGCDTCREYLTWLDPAIALLPASVAQRQPPRSLKRALMKEVRQDIKAAERSDHRSRRASNPLAALWRPATALAVVAVMLVGAVAGYGLRGESDATDPTVTIAAETNRPAGKLASATLEVTGDRGTLYVEGLPALPVNRVYQAWIQRNGKMEPSTPFVVRKDGSSQVAIEGNLAGASGIYVTREPGGGSRQPTLPVVMQALL